MQASMYEWEAKGRMLPTFCYTWWNDSLKTFHLGCAIALKQFYRLVITVQTHKTAPNDEETRQLVTRSSSWLVPPSSGAVLRVCTMMTSL